MDKGLRDAAEAGFKQVWGLELPAQYPVRLLRHVERPDRYAVLYGPDSLRPLSRAEASDDLGRCILHALEGAGRLAR